jgi:general secretion pathway protein D
MRGCSRVFGNGRLRGAGSKSNSNSHGGRKDDFSGFCAYARGPGTLYLPPSIRMVTENPNFPSRGLTFCLAALLLASPIGVAQSGGASQLATRETARRAIAVQEAQELLRKGDQLYQKKSYADALEVYAGARDLIPNVPHFSALHGAATERYAQASVEHARELSRAGDVAGAKAVVDRVLREGVAPNDPGALALQAELDDPIRTNPALTAKHASDVDEVRRRLYTAEGAYDLGKFDQAEKEYHGVLRIDSTNTAARRGLERVAAAKQEYFKSAADHTRKEMLTEVDAAWELELPEPELVPAFVDPGAVNDFSRPTLIAKLDQIIIPRVIFDQTTLDEALDYLRNRAVEFDTTESDPARKGVNFTLNLGPPASASSTRIANLRFDLQLSQVPLSRVLKYVTELTETSYRTDEFSVIISPLGTDSAELVSRSYRVPPDFLTTLSAGFEKSGDEEDPFSTTKTGGALLTERLSASEALAKQGVSFPEGASVSYSPVTNTLQVVNTETNQDLISQIIDNMARAEPVVVSVEVTMFRVSKVDLEELGFDWLLTPASVDPSGTVVVGGGTTGNTPGRTAADFTPTIPGLPLDPDAIVNPGVITNGNRSGDQAILGNSLDAILANPDRDPSICQSRPRNPVSHRIVHRPQCTSHHAWFEPEKKR